MKKNKNDALYEFKKMIIESWTYKKMTADEQITLFKIFDDTRTQDALKGNFYQRWEILQAIYGTFLAAIGYTSFNWRDDND